MCRWVRCTLKGKPWISFSLKVKQVLRLQWQKKTKWWETEGSGRAAWRLCPPRSFSPRHPTVTLRAPGVPSPENGRQDKQLLYRNEAKWKASDSREGFSSGIEGNQRSAGGKGALSFSRVPVALREGLVHWFSMFTKDPRGTGAGVEWRAHMPLCPHGAGHRAPRR